VKAVLPAAGLGLLVCIGLAALLVVGRRAAPSAASHLGAPRLGTAQPAGPPTALPASPALLLNPDAVSFGDGPTERTAHAIYVVNLGPAPVTIRTIAITGPDRAAFAATDTCTRKTISVYAGCTISVRITPMARRGTHKATLRITPNAPGNAQRVPLSA
jgi:hypothetical protein